MAAVFEIALIVVVAGMIPSSASAAAAAELHNITTILEGFPEYSLYNSYLSQTKVCDEINTRQIVTCLVLDNVVMSDFVAERSLAVVKNALRVLTLLDYFDAATLHGLPGGTTLSTTLLQATGVVAGKLGSVNITDLLGGSIGFASAAPGSEFSSTFTKAVKQIPNNLSVLEVSAAIVFPGLLDAPAASLSSLTSLLDEAGCKTFSSLLATSGVVEMFQDAMDQGLTVFAPDDVAFEAAPDLSSLPGPDLVTLLQYHSLPSYTPKSSLQIASGRRVATLASSGAGNYDLSVVSRGGDEVSLDTGVGTSRVASTILDDPPVCVLTVDSVLLPVELFGSGSLRASAPAPAPPPGPEMISGPIADGTSPSPSPVEEALAPATVAKAPASTQFTLLGPATGSQSQAENPQPDDDGNPSAETSMAAAGSLTTSAVCLVSWAMSRSWLL